MANMDTAEGTRREVVPLADRGYCWPAIAVVVIAVALATGRLVIATSAMEGNLDGGVLLAWMFSLWQPAALIAVAASMHNQPGPFETWRTGRRSVRPDVSVANTWSIS